MMDSVEQMIILKIGSVLTIRPRIVDLGRVTLKGGPAHGSSNNHDLAWRFDGVMRRSPMVRGLRRFKIIADGDRPHCSGSLK